MLSYGHLRDLAVMKQSRVQGLNELDDSKKSKIIGGPVASLLFQIVVIGNFSLCLGD